MYHANEGNIANHVYTFHTNFTPETRADELMRKMWDEEVVEITNQNKPLNAEEVLATRKVAESRCDAKGRYEVAIPWQDDEPPLYCNRTTAEDRSTLLRSTYNEGRTLLRNIVR